MGFCNDCQVGPTGKVTLCAPCANRMVIHYRKSADAHKAHADRLHATLLRSDSMLSLLRHRCAVTIPWGTTGIPDAQDVDQIIGDSRRLLVDLGDSALCGGCGHHREKHQPACIMDDASCGCRQFEFIA